MLMAQARANVAYGQAGRGGATARQVVLLLDGAIGRLREAATAGAEGRIEDRWQAVMKANAIIEAMHNCLDFERGAEVAAALDRFYTYVLVRMQQINVRNDGAVCAELVAHLNQLREAWAILAETAPAIPAGAAGFGRAVA